MTLKNTKIIVIVGVLSVAVIAAALLFTTGGIGGGLSGRYESSSQYLEFKGGNKVTIYSGHYGGDTSAMQGTYTLSGNQLTVKATVTVMGFSDTYTGHGTVSDDKQEITFEGSLYKKAR